jgi:hypothetical protein
VIGGFTARGVGGKGRPPGSLRMGRIVISMG